MARSLLALAYLLQGGLAACGNGNGLPQHDASRADAPPLPVDVHSIDSRIAREPCNAFTNGGCNADEKCTFLVDTFEPLTGRMGCEPEGQAELDMPCSYSELPFGLLVDDCQQGLWCDPSGENGGICRTICCSDYGCDVGECTEVDPNFMADVGTPPGVFCGLCQGE